jgi:DNA ligase (NAD+)
VIPEKNHKVIRGEAVITYSMFKKVNEKLPAGTEPYKNPRNLCSGTIRNLNPQIVADRCVTFFAFEYVEGSNTNSHSESIAALKNLGFGTVYGKIVKREEIADAVKWFSEEIKTNDFPSDGLVLVYDDIAYGKSLGMTSHHPRSGIAYKWKDESAETTIRKIDWSVSRTSLINPVAVFDTVDLEGTDVSRASIHNISIMKSLQLGVGDKVEVIKANMIIPQIVKNITKNGKIEIPAVCPVCGAPTKIKVDENSGTETLYCTGANCVATATTKIAHYCSRDAMNIVGISEKTIGSFFEEGILHTIPDIYKLESCRESIVEMEGFGTKKYENMVNAINASKHVEFYRFLYAIGIPNFGLSNCKAVCKKLKLNAVDDLFAITKDALMNIDGVGEVMADSFVAYFKDEENDELVRALSEFITFRADDEEGSDALVGKTFVITGSLNRMSRKELQALIEKNGGKVSGSVSSNTTALINNDATSGSSKNKTAHSLGVRIVTEEEFFNEYKIS